MKKLFFIMLAALIGLSCYAQKNEKVLYSLTPNMNCQNCVNRVQQALTAIEGVSSVKPDLATQTVEVVYNPTTLKPEIIVNALTAIGYTAKQTTLEEASRAMKRVIDANPGIVTAIDGKSVAVRRLQRGAMTVAPSTANPPFTSVPTASVRRKRLKKTLRPLKRR